MVEYDSILWPSVVAIFYNLDVARDLIRILKGVLRDRNIGFKYCAFKSFLGIMGKTGTSISQYTNMSGMAVVICDAPRPLRHIQLVGVSYSTRDHSE
jgi:hypothetical protein